MSLRARLVGRAMTIACACGGLAGASMGLAFPLISLALETRYGSGPLIGWNAAAGAISTLVGAAMTPALLRRFGVRELIAGAAATSALFFVSFIVLESLAAWFALRFLFGGAVTVVFVASEIWVNRLAPPNRRGRYLGLFAASLAAGLGVGAATFAVVGRFEAAAFIAGGVFLLTCLLVVRIRAPQIRVTGASTGVSGFVATSRAAPLAILAAIAFGAIETGALNFLPVYAVRAGYGISGASALMIAASLGNVALTAPLGRVADAVGRVRALLACAAASSVIPIALIFGPAPSLAYAAPLVFLYAGIAAALYPIGLARLAERIPASQISQANAAFVMFYGLGSLLSPPAAGVMIDAIDPDGLLITLAVFAAVLLAAGIVSALNSRRPRIDRARAYH